MATEPIAAPFSQPVETSVSASGEHGQTSNPQASGETNSNNESEKWGSELHLVSSLSRLQELEGRIHQLRTLLPDRLMAPIAPIINPNGAAPDKPFPASPHVLLTRLSHAAHAGVAEVEQFQAAWRSPEMKAIWDHVGDEIREDGGKLLQPTGVWERDYGALLEEYVRGDHQGDRREGEEEEVGCSAEEAESVMAKWRTDFEAFLQKLGSVSGGIRIRTDEHEPLIMIGLVKAGLLFQARAVKESDDDIPKWRVSNVVLPPRRSKTTLEMAICDCLNSRRRQWDLTYLLEMISSYADIKQTPCAKCNKLTDTSAQLPVFRVPGVVDPSGSRLSPPTQGSRPIIDWKPFHSGCI